MFRTLCIAGVLITCVPPAANSASVLFRESEGYQPFIPSWDHVGFEMNGFVWESHPGYEYQGFPLSGFAWDPSQGNRVLVPDFPGVQRYHTRGSFEWNSATSATSPTEAFLAIDIDSGLASAMEDIAITTVGGYPNLFNPYNAAPNQQKGGGGSFTCVGLIEYFAEQAGHNGGEGFIPNDREHFLVFGRTVPLLTPKLLLTAIQRNWTPTDDDDFIPGLFDPVDFLVTDPLGRRAGYTTETGLLEEIPGVSYDGDGDYEQFFMANPMAGTYQVDLYGLGDDAFAAISDGQGGGFLFEGYLEEGEVVSGSFQLGTESLEGDFDLDGDVDGEDFLKWQREDSTSVGLTAWQNNYGLNSSNLPQSSMAIPEPSTLLLIIWWYIYCPLRAPSSR